MNNIFMLNLLNGIKEAKPPQVKSLSRDKNNRVWLKDTSTKQMLSPLQIR